MCSYLLERVTRGVHRVACACRADKLCDTQHSRLRQIRWHAFSHLRLMDDSFRSAQIFAINLMLCKVKILSLVVAGVLTKLLHMLCHSFHCLPVGVTLCVQLSRSSHSAHSVVKQPSTYTTHMGSPYRHGEGKQSRAMRLSDQIHFVASVARGACARAKATSCIKRHNGMVHL